MVTYWYGMPGARSNRTPQPDEAKQKLMKVSEIERLQQMVKDSLLIFNQEKLLKLIN
jgi:hypothetical protein